MYVQTRISNIKPIYERDLSHMNELLYMSMRRVTDFFFLSHVIYTYETRRYVPPKSPMTSGSFAERDLQLMAFLSHIYLWGDKMKPAVPYVICDIRWPRLIGCLKLQVIFRKRATNHRALLRKMTSEDKALYASTPLCMTYPFVTWRIFICDMAHSNFSRRRSE